MIERLEARREPGRIPQELGQLSYREVIMNSRRAFYRGEFGKVFIVRVMRQYPLEEQ